MTKDEDQPFNSRLCVFDGYGEDDLLPPEEEEERDPDAWLLDYGTASEADKAFFQALLGKQQP